MATRYVKMDKVEGGDEEPEFRTARKPRCLKCSVIILILLLILTVAAATTFAVLFFLGIGKSTSSEICTSDACSRLASRMRKAMNQSADPCEDFYNFACGNWLSQNNFTSDLPGYGTLELQARVVYGELADVLESDFTSDIAALVKVKTFYESCTNIEAIESSGWTPLRNLYKEIGGWSLVHIPGDGSTWSINSTQFVQEKMVQSPAFYAVEVKINDSNSSNYVLEIAQSGLSEDAAHYFNRTFTDQLKELIYYALSELAGETSGSFRGASENIVNFETYLAEIWELDYETEDNSVVLSVQNLSQLWPGYNWLGTFQQLFEPSGVVIEPTQSVVVKNPDYFTNLTDLIMSIPEEILEDYAKWQLFITFIEVVPRSSDFVEHLRNFRKSVLGKATNELRLECVNLVQKVMPLALGRVYADHILQPGTREVVRNFVDEVKSGLRQRMTTRDWLDDTTRHLSIEKLNAIYAMIAYPNQTTNNTYLNTQYAKYNFNVNKFIENYIHFLRESRVHYFSLLMEPVDRTQWIEAPTDVNAYYFAPFNHIVVLEGILHLPTFDDDWPIYVQYGGLGSILGHELTHGFDNHGRLYDKNGIRRQWWTNASIEEFIERTQCFVQQYSEYEMFGYHVNGNLTLGENIADNGGLKASFGAYRKVANQQSSIPGLKGLNYTEDQLFFIAFSQVWCSYSTATSFRTQVLTDEHSPNMFRVIGSLVNNPDFAEVFSCPVQSPMNPEDKCLLW